MSKKDSELSSNPELTGDDTVQSVGKSGPSNHGETGTPSLEARKALALRLLNQSCSRYSKTHPLPSQMETFKDHNSTLARAIKDSGSIRPEDFETAHRDMTNLAKTGDGERNDSVCNPLDAAVVINKEEQTDMTGIANMLLDLLNKVDKQNEMEQQIMTATARFNKMLTMSQVIQAEARNVRQQSEDTLMSFIAGYTIGASLSDAILVWGGRGQSSYGDDRPPEP